MKFPDFEPIYTPLLYGYEIGYVDVEVDWEKFCFTGKMFTVFPALSSRVWTRTLSIEKSLKAPPIIHCLFPTLEFRLKCSWAPCCLTCWIFRFEF